MNDLDKRVEEIRRWHEDLVSRGGCYPCDRGRCPAPILLAAYDAMKHQRDILAREHGRDCIA